MGNDRRRENGFTLIELMVVVLVIAVLIAVAIPIMRAAWEKTTDRSVQADIQSTLKAERAWFSDGEEFTDDPVELESVEAALDYLNGDVPVVEDSVYVHLDAGGVLFLSARSATGRCWYLRGDPDGRVGYAQSAACGAAGGQTYRRRPW